MTENKGCNLDRVSDLVKLTIYKYLATPEYFTAYPGRLEALCYETAKNINALTVNEKNSPVPIGQVFHEKNADKITVTEIYCKCGLIHSYAGKQDHYLGSKKFGAKHA